MFGGRFWGARFFARRYFGKSGTAVVAQVRDDGGFPRLFKEAVQRKPILLDLEIASTVSLFIQVRTSFTKRYAGEARARLPSVSVRSKQTLLRQAGTRAHLSLAARSSSTRAVAHASRAHLTAVPSARQNVVRNASSGAVMVHLSAANRVASGRVHRSGTSLFGSVRSHTERAVKAKYTGTVGLGLAVRAKVERSPIVERIEASDQRDIDVILLLKG